METTKRARSEGESKDGKRIISFVTGNPKKLAEFKAIMGSDLPLANASVNLPELQGEPEVEKCKEAAKVVNGPVICEDTSLCFNALHGLPGPYIKHFLDKLKHEGLNKLLAPYEDKSAYAMCIFTYSEGPGKPIEVFEGRCEGIIVQARGPPHFGWDPVFQPTPGTQTFAEMENEAKHKISHRGRALAKLQAYLATNWPKAQ